MPDPQNVRAIVEMPQPEILRWCVRSAPVLSYYKLYEALEAQCGSSQAGIGAALMQGGHPKAYASRALTET